MKNKKKILFVMQVPPPITGAALRNSEIVEIFSDDNDFSIRLLPISLVKSVSGLSSFSLMKIFRSISLYIKTVYNLIFFRPDIVYVTPVPTGFAYWRDLILISILKISGKKIIYHLRPLGFREGSIVSRTKNVLNKFMFRKVSVICLSSITAHDIDGLYKANPHILNNGIEVVDLENGYFKERKPVVLFLSNLFVAKGVMDFLEMLSILNKKGEKFDGRIYGEEGDINRLHLERSIKDLGLEDHVAYMGEVSGRSKYKVFKEADVFVFPTHKENFPGVVLEAMQSSLPVVSVIEGSIPEIVVNGETGFLHEKGDNVSAATSIIELIRDESLRKRMGAAGKEVFMKNFTIDVFRKNIINLINSEFDNNK